MCNGAESALDMCVLGLKVLWCLYGAESALVCVYGAESALVCVYGAESALVCVLGLKVFWCVYWDKLVCLINTLLSLQCVH